MIRLGPHPSRIKAQSVTTLRAQLLARFNAQAEVMVSVWPEPCDPGSGLSFWSGFSPLIRLRAQFVNRIRTQSPTSSRV